MFDVVCAVIRDQEGRFLVCKRAEGKALAGSWEFPGGKVESGEDFQLALQREMMEELACEIKVGEQLPAVEHHYPDYSIRLLPFICSISRGTPTALEHAEILWATPDQCRLLHWAPADVPVWRALFSA
jgi:8-oxo-dGTP diphosphatase